VRDTVFKGGRSRRFPGFEGSQAVHVRPLIYVRLREAKGLGSEKGRGLCYEQSREVELVLTLFRETVAV
jgi:hypothetical protein